MATPWSLLPNDKYAALANQPMVPGLVDPTEATPPPEDPDTQDFLQQQAAALASAQQAYGKQANNWKAHREQVDQEKSQNSINKILRTTPQEYRDLEKMIMDSPAYKNQEQGLGQLDALAKASIEHAPVNFDYSPLQTLANYVNKTNLPAPQVRNPDWGALSGMVGEIQKRRGDLFKSLREGIASTKAGSTQDLLVSSLLNKTGNDIGLSPEKAGGTEAKESAIAHRAHTQLMTKMASDKILNQELGGYVTQSNALSALVNAKHLTVQTINDAQQALRRGIQLGSGSQSGVDERAETYIRGMGFDWDKVLQFINNKPQEVAKDHPLVESVLDLAKIEQQNMQTHFGKRLDALTGGFSWIYNDPRFSSEAATPYDNLKGALMNALGGYHNLTKQSGPSFKAAPEKSSGIGDKFINALKSLPSKSASPSPAPAPAAPAAPKEIPLSERFKKALESLPKAGQ